MRKEKKKREQFVVISGSANRLRVKNKGEGGAQQTASYNPGWVILISSLERARDLFFSWKGGFSGKHDWSRSNLKFKFYFERIARGMDALDDKLKIIFQEFQPEWKFSGYRHAVVRHNSKSVKKITFSCYKSTLNDSRKRNSGEKSQGGALMVKSGRQYNLEILFIPGERARYFG